MKGFQEIAEKIINKAISGTFILRNGDKINSKYLESNFGFTKYPYLLNETSYTADGIYYTGFSSDLDVIDFIPDTKYLNHIESAVSLLNCVFVPPQYFKNENGIIYKLVGKEENLYVFENMHNGSIVYKTAYQATKLISTDSILENVLNYMETKRNITLTLEKAKEWYKKGGELKEVALQAFKEEELKNSKPRSWNAFCEKYPIGNNEYYIHGSDGSIRKSAPGKRDAWADTAVLPSKKLAEAFLAMMQLMSLRQAWIGDWKPDWSKSNYCVAATDNGIYVGVLVNFTHPLSFPTEEMATDFMNTFKDLLEVAKPLI